MEPIIFNLSDGWTFFLLWVVFLGILFFALWTYFYARWNVYGPKFKKMFTRNKKIVDDKTKLSKIEKQLIENENINEANKIETLKVSEADSNLNSEQIETENKMSIQELLNLQKEKDRLERKQAQNDLKAQKELEEKQKEEELKKQFKENKKKNKNKSNSKKNVTSKIDSNLENKDNENELLELDNLNENKSIESNQTNLENDNQDQNLNSKEDLIVDSNDNQDQNLNSKEDSIEKENDSNNKNNIEDKNVELAKSIEQNFGNKIEIIF